LALEKKHYSCGEKHRLKELMMENVTQIKQAPAHKQMMKNNQQTHKYKQQTQTPRSKLHGSSKPVPQFVYKNSGARKPCTPLNQTMPDTKAFCAKVISVISNL